MDASQASETTIPEYHPMSPDGLATRTAISELTSGAAKLTSRTVAKGMYCIFLTQGNNIHQTTIIIVRLRLADVFAPAGVDVG